MPDLPLPVEFRASVLAPAIDLLRAGESVALVGVGSSGKSNVARYLARADVRLHYFGEDAALTLVLYVNCKPLAARPSHDWFLHALDQLESALEEMNGVFTTARPEVTALWQAAQANPETLARRNLDRAVSLVTRSGAKHIVVILDDCDDLFAQAPPSFFSELRALRDNVKYRLAYLTLSRREPAFLRTGTKDYEELFELLSAPGHTLPVPPYGEAEGLQMVQRLAARQSPPAQLAEDEIHRIYGLAGGHGGLTRSVFFAGRGDVALDAPEAAETLAANADVADECRKIWDSLEAEEQADLLRIASGGGPSADGLRRLARRGLVRGGREVFSPVFARFLAGMAGTSKANGLALEFAEAGASAGQVKINGRWLAGLGRPEYELLRRLSNARPRACTRVELLEAMRLGEREGRPGEASGDPLRRLEHYLQRLKARLGANGRYVLADGDGYRLAA